MSDNHNNLDQLLDDWVNKKISLEEVNRLSGVNDLEQIKQDAKLHQLTIEAVEQYGIAQKIEKVHNAFVYAPVIPIQQKENTFMYWSVRIAATVILMIGTYLASRELVPNTQSVYSDTFQAYYLGNERGMSGKNSTNLVAYFKAQNYQQVISIYQQLDAPTQRERFLTGYAYLVTDRPTDAITMMEMVLANNRNSGKQAYHDDAEYYLALAYLKTNETRKAKLLLEEIYANPEHTYHDNINNWDLKILKWFY